MRRFSPIAVLLALLPIMLATIVPARGDGSISETNATLGSIQRTDLYWSSLTNRSDGSISWFSGEVLRVDIVPDGTLTNDYVVVFTDHNGIDLLGEDGEVGSNTTFTFCPGIDCRATTRTNAIPPVACGPLNIAVTNTGVGSGLVVIYWRK